MCIYLHKAQHNIQQSDQGHEYKFMGKNIQICIFISPKIYLNIQRPFILLLQLCISINNNL